MNELPAECSAERDDLKLDRRQWPRHESAVRSIALWMDAETMEDAHVLDESQTGMAVLVRDPSKLTHDLEVRVEYDGRPMWAIVKYIGPHESGMHQIGLQWGAAKFRPGDMERLVEELEQASRDLTAER